MPPLAVLVQALARSSEYRFNFKRERKTSHDDEQWQQWHLFMTSAKTTALTQQNLLSTRRQLLNLDRI